jgi:hypothetical protein
MYFLFACGTVAIVQINLRGDVFLAEFDNGK